MQIAGKILTCKKHMKSKKGVLQFLQAKKKVLHFSQAKKKKKMAYALDDGNWRNMPLLFLHFPTFFYSKTKGKETHVQFSTIATVTFIHVLEKLVLHHFQ
jgi:hypothetical protein